MRTSLLTLFALLGLLPAACLGGDGDQDLAPSPTGEAPTAEAASPSARATSPSSEVSCDVPGSIKSFRFTIGVKMDMPGLEEQLPEVKAALRAGQQEGEGDPFEGEGEGLAQLAFAWILMSDVRAEGAFVAPDRREVQVRFLEELHVSQVVIGDRAWTKRGAAGWEESTGETEDFGLVMDPAILCQASKFPGIAGLEAREETVNGVTARHHHLEKADIERLMQLFGGDEAVMWDAEDLPQEVSVDLWLAKEGHWPVRVECEFTFAYDEADVGVSMFMEVKDLNDPAIKVEPPIDSD